MIVVAVVFVVLVVLWGLVPRRARPHEGRLAEQQVRAGRMRGGS